MADFNGDGIPDIVTSNRGDNTVSVLLGNGDGTFEPQETFPTGKTPRTVAVGDFNGDGNVDIVTANLGDDTASVLLGRGDGTFSFGAHRPPRLPRLRPFQVVVADLTGNGIPDIITANRPRQQRERASGQPRRLVPDQGDLSPRATGPFSVAVADLNGDGIPDIVTANYDGADVSVLLGNGDGTFQPYYDLPAGSDPYDVKVADLTGDGIARHRRHQQERQHRRRAPGQGQRHLRAHGDLPGRLRALRGRGGRPDRQRHSRPRRQPLQRHRGGRAFGQRQRYVSARA